MYVQLWAKFLFSIQTLTISNLPPAFWVWEFQAVHMRATYARSHTTSGRRWGGFFKTHRHLLQFRIKQKSLSLLGVQRKWPSTDRNVTRQRRRRGSLSDWMRTTDHWTLQLSRLREWATENCWGSSRIDRKFTNETKECGAEWTTELQFARARGRDKKLFCWLEKQLRSLREQVGFHFGKNHMVSRSLEEGQKMSRLLYQTREN